MNIHIFILGKCMNKAHLPPPPGLCWLRRDSSLQAPSNTTQRACGQKNNTYWEATNLRLLSDFLWVNTLRFKFFLFVYALASFCKVSILSVLKDVRRCSKSFSMPPCRSRSSRSRCQARRPRSKLWPSARKRGVSKDRPTSMKRWTKDAQKVTKKCLKCLHHSHLWESNMRRFSHLILCKAPSISHPLWSGTSSSAPLETQPRWCAEKRHGERAAHSWLPAFAVRPCLRSSVARASLKLVCMRLKNATVACFFAFRNHHKQHKSFASMSDVDRSTQSRIDCSICAVGSEPNFHDFRVPIFTRKTFPKHRKWEWPVCASWRGPNWVSIGCSIQKALHYMWPHR